MMTENVLYIGMFDSSSSGQHMWLTTQEKWFRKLHETRWVSIGRFRIGKTRYFRVVKAFIAPLFLKWGMFNWSRFVLSSFIVFKTCILKRHKRVVIWRKLSETASSWHRYLSETASSWHRYLLIFALVTVKSSWTWAAKWHEQKNNWHVVYFSTLTERKNVYWEPAYA